MVTITKIGEEYKNVNLKYRMQKTFNIFLGIVNVCPAEYVRCQSVNQSKKQ